MTKTIFIGSDHAGFELKHILKDHLRNKGFEVQDKGTHVKDSVDYPDYAHAVAKSVVAEPDSFGIVICGSGNGVNISVNRHKGIRAALAWSEEIAELGRQHNNANVLSLPARFISDDLAIAIVDTFVSTKFEGGRHQLRVNKIELDA
ncbi:MAG: ribose 5-phosphate isomerase B [Flavobacteriales bacterium]|nr:ribose 5-phosphate isomerase B [Flavobacteriales bacterium]MBK6944336.1 ribose 5-phosphate isomerase B [Flavobacteriales bacterium]MBK7242120.1 ribose 5-phosphate isomerase B [Flavobacteriales bacterium]MBK9534003.1 ribose 5-phosphate isomerase B [Flavobacteriales bacterium]MBP9137529.1 ribose 5-phosphate isomerase B [Flavobacteriales bacterium]